MIDCKTCRYWRQFNKTGQDGARGECRRFPPPNDDPGCFPITKENDWCGEYNIPVDMKLGA